MANVFSIEDLLLEKIIKDLRQYAIEFQCCLCNKEIRYGEYKIKICDRHYVHE